MAVILVVDDRELNREFLVTLLRYRGHELMEASEGSEGLSIARTSAPDLIISDILMPAMDGYEFVRQLRGDPRTAKIPVVFFSAHYLEREARALATRCGVRHIIQKPAVPTEILRIVDEELGIRKAPPPQAPTEELNAAHLRLITDKLAKKNDDLALVNGRLSALIETLSTGPDPILLGEATSKAARLIIGAVYAGIRTSDAIRPGTAHFWYSGLDPEEAAKLAKASPWDGVIGEIIEKQTSRRIRNPNGDPTALGLTAAHPPVTSFIGVPIVSRGRAYGCLFASNKLGGEEFSDEDERLATLLAGHFATAYENSCLYVEASLHAKELEQENARRRRAEEEMHASQDRIRLILDSTVEAIYGLDLDGNCTFCNRACVRLLGYEDHADLVGKHLHSLIHHTRADGSAYAVEDCNIYKAYLKGQPVYANDEVLWRADGTSFPVEYWSHPIISQGSVVGCVVSFLDVTEHKRLEEKFRQSQKMEAVGQLAGGIAHDFNNLLTVIIGYSKLQLADSTPQDPSYHRLQEIQNAAERAADLTGQLLAFSRKQVLQPRVINLGDTLRSMDQMIRRLIGEHIVVLTTVDDRLGQVKIDPIQVQQVVLNLVVNARDAMPHGGKLTIDVINQEIDEASGRLHNIPAGKYVMVSVSDNGHGMTPEVRRRVFEPFFTTKEVGLGTGLGLATVHGIVQQSGGHICVYSEPEMGTTFKILFPMVDEPVPEPQRALPAPRNYKMIRQPRTILVVEDDPNLRDLAQEVLTSAGYHVLSAENGKQAFRIAEEHAAPVALLLTDVVLPELGGKEIARRLTLLRPDIRVLFMSGYSGNAISRSGTLDPAVDFIQKPWTPDARCEKIRTVLETRSSIQRILVVDDEAGIRNWLAEILEAAGYRVFLAQNGHEGRALAQVHSVDLVITDLVMPDEEGLEMIRSIRKDHRDLKIIAMSGMFGPSVLRAAEILGAHTALTKPLTAETVLDSIRSL